MLKLLNIALRAGREIMEVYKTTFSVDYKEDKTPLTEADRRSHKAILEGLKGIDPSLPVLSEEGKGFPYEERKSWRRFWLVDPLDGTKEFVKRNGEFTVNIALVEDGRPIMGVVYAPALGVMYFSEKGKGAYKLAIEGENLTEEDMKRAERLPMYRDPLSKRTLRVVASRSHMSEETKAFIDRLRERYGKVETLSIGSSLKICLVAEGKADVYPRLGPTMEWDTAAAHAIALESGCDLYSYEKGVLGSPLEYNKEDLRNPPFVCVGRLNSSIFKSKAR